MCETTLEQTSGTGAPRSPVTDACVIIPMFNEAATIFTVVSALRVLFDRIVCVDDGSSDNCAALARLAGASVVRHPVNLGQGAALQTGIDYALAIPTVEFFVTFDADAQHQPTDAVAMLGCARRGQADVVLGSRFLGTSSQGMPWSRRAVLRLAVGFTNVTSGLRLTDTHNGLRVLNRRAAGAVKMELAGMAHASEILNGISRKKLTVEEHAVTVFYTEHSLRNGQSNFNAVNIIFDLFVHRLRNAR